MITEFLRQFRAQYDQGGNIILPQEDSINIIDDERHNIVIQKNQWSKPPKTAQEVWQDVRSEVQIVANHVEVVATEVIDEGRRQYDFEHAGTSNFFAELAQDLQMGLIGIIRFLVQPVWVPQGNRTERKQSRLSLFASDVVRFGATFACIFVLLFGALNYESFWQILRSKLDPLADMQASAALEEVLHESPTTLNAGVDRIKHGHLLGALPIVGPPEDRLIIPKINVNIPIKIPSNASLLREDWDQLEEDIQVALRGGAAHYPGTAAPGQAGNFFLTAHSSYYATDPGDYKAAFALLPQLEVGDEFWVYYGGDKHRYRIKRKYEVSPSDVSVLDQPTHKRQGTLMTCVPIGTTLRRLIVESEEIDPISGKVLAVGEHTTRPNLPKIQAQALPI